MTLSPGVRALVDLEHARVRDLMDEAGLSRFQGLYASSDALSMVVTQAIAQTIVALTDGVECSPEVNARAVALDEWLRGTG